MDVVRGAAVLLIVVFHATVFVEQYGGLTAPRWIAEVNTVVTPLRIPLLILLSGVLLGQSIRKGRHRYFSGKLRNVAWPYLVWATVWGALSWPVYSLLGYALGGSYLWFLLYLLSFYCLAWFLRGVPAELVGVVAVIASVLAPEGTLNAERWPYLFALFMLGHLLTARPRLRQWLFASPWALPAAAVLLTLHLALGLGYGYGLESALFTIAVGTLIMRAARAYGSARPLRPLRFVGRNSLVFYAAHYPLMAGAAIGARAAGVSSAALLWVVLLVVAIVGSAVLARWRQHPPISWLFTAPRPHLSRGLTTPTRPSRQ